MGLFDTIRRAVGGDDSSTDGAEQAAGDDRPSDDGPELLDTATLDPTAFREYAERVVEGADPLTFDPDALARLDTAIEESYDGKTAGDAAGVTTYTENTVRFGSYLGEILVRAYDGEWVQSDGRWGVAVAGPDDEVGVAVFDVAARSFGDEPVFAAVVTRLESDLALDTVAEIDDERQASETDETDAESVVSEPTRVVRRVDDGQADDHADASEPTATDKPDGAAATDTADSESPQAGETEPTRVVRRVEPQADGDDQSDDTDPTSVVSRVAEEPPSDTAADDSAADTADEQPTAESATAESALDAPESEPAADTAETVETTADDTAETAAADEAASYIDEAEPAFDSATADLSDEAPASEASPDESGDSRDEGGTVDTASAGAATDTSTDEAATDTADDGAAGEPMDDESALDSSPDASSDAVPDAAAPEPEVAESPADTADAAGVDDASAGVAEPNAGEPSDGGPATSSPAEDAPLTDDDSAAGSARNWESGTVRAAHAETAVEFADFWGEHDLDFSPASLARLDDLVDSEWDDERFAETTFGSDASFDDRAFTSVVRELGGYFGEVLVRQLDGEWTDETDHEAAVVVGGSGGQFAVPVFDVAITSLRKQAVFGRSYDALLADLGRDGPTR